MSVPSILLAKENWKSGKLGSRKIIFVALIKCLQTVFAAFHRRMMENIMEPRNQLRQNISKVLSLVRSDEYDKTEAKYMTRFTSRRLNKHFLLLSQFFRPCSRKQAHTHMAQKIIKWHKMCLRSSKLCHPAEHSKRDHRWRRYERKHHQLTMPATLIQDKRSEWTWHRSLLLIKNALETRSSRVTREKVTKTAN